MSVSLETPRAWLVSSDNFPSQASSIIWKNHKKYQRKNAQNSDKTIYCQCVSANKVILSYLISYQILGTRSCTIIYYLKCKHIAFITYYSKLETQVIVVLNSFKKFSENPIDIEIDDYKTGIGKPIAIYS